MLRTGGLTIVGAEWLGPRHLRLRVRTLHEEAVQIYAGGRLAGFAPAGRAGRIAVVDADVPQTVRSVRLRPVSTERPDVDHDADLPARPRNVPTVRIPAQVGDVARVVAQLTDSGGTLTKELRAFPGTIVFPPRPTGDVSLSVTAHDGRRGGGNPGTAVVVSARSESDPLDLTGSPRFTAAPRIGGLTLIATMPDDF